MFNKFSISGVNALPRFSNEASFTEIVNVPKSSNLPIYFHIPFCNTICSFCMLRKGAKAADEIPDSFILSLLSEIERKSFLFENRKISSIYFGGGTPSLLSPNQVSKIYVSLVNRFNIEGDCEITFEGEAKSLCNLELLKELKSIGIKRISFGVQTLNEQLRHLLGRTDSIQDIVKTIELVKKIDFQELNIDYLYNLPDTTPHFIVEEIKYLLRLGINSFDFHPLKYISVSSSILRKIYNLKMKLPSNIERIEMYNSIRELMLDNGIGEHFVDQYSSLNRRTTNSYMQNLYGLNGGEYIGFGPGSRSHFGDYGYSNIQSVDEYKKNLESGGFAILNSVHAPLLDNYITCFPKRNDLLKIEDILLSSNPQYYFKQFEKLIDEGYIKGVNNYFSLTTAGLNWYQNVQEYLLSPAQRFNHLEKALVRQNKFADYNGYFSTIGEILEL